MKIIVFGWVKVVLLCFKHITLYTKQNFRFLFNLIDGERLLLVVLGVTILSDKILQISIIPILQYHFIFLKYNKVVEVLSRFLFYNFILLCF